MSNKAIVRSVLAVAVVCCAVAAHAVTIDLAPIGDPGNTGDTAVMSPGGASGFGAVDYVYQIGKYEVTAGQYTDFLNAVAKVDTYQLYYNEMSSVSYGSGIARSGSGTIGDPYTYTVATNFINRPVNYVSYWDSCRFANWLHNGQPTGAQGANTTETGAYTLTEYGISSNTVVRNTDWKWAVTSEDEWYKAAYYKGGSKNAGYFMYSTGSNAIPGLDRADVSGNNANLSGPQYPPTDRVEYSTVVGEYQNSASPYGTFDQTGNVAEWNESIFSTRERGWRGGSFAINPDDLLATSMSFFSSGASGGAARLGFRVVMVPEPGSLAMMCGVALAGLLCWWRKFAAA